MTREEYGKDKAAKIAAKKRVIDLVQPACVMPDMFREEISAYEITKESLWVDTKGGMVAFGGVYDRDTKEYINKTVMLNPTFTQLVATGAGVTACGEPDIEKHKSVFDLIMPSGSIRKIPYTSRVVGRISFKRLTPSGSPETKFYSTEIDVDSLLNEAIVTELEKIGTKDKYKKVDGEPLKYTEENIKYSTGSDYKDSLQKFDKLNELAKHAYQKVDTKLRSHGAEKFIGIPNITENMIGAFIYVSRISYNTNDPKIAQALAIGAVQDILGIRAPKRIVDDAVQDLASDDIGAETATNVTEDTIPGDTVEEPDVASDTKLAGECVLKIEEWLRSGAIKDPVVSEYLEKIISCTVSSEVLSFALSGITAIVAGKSEDGFKDILRSAQKTPAFLVNEKASAAVGVLIENFNHASFTSYLCQATKKLSE